MTSTSPAIPSPWLYGEKLGIPFTPVGIYDYTNRLIYTVESDYNGLWDVLLPSTNRISCPTPSGVCANLYRFVGNDPGTPGRWNPNYNPQYRTIAAEFEAFPGLTLPADLAPTPVAVAVQIPGTQTLTPVSCTAGRRHTAVLCDQQALHVHQLERCRPRPLRSPGWALARHRASAG